MQVKLNVFVGAAVLALAGTATTAFAQDMVVLTWAKTMKWVPRWPSTSSMPRA